MPAVGPSPGAAAFDQAVVVVAVEVGLRIFACGGAFPRSVGLVDLAIVLITVMPIDDGFGLRTLRILRCCACCRFSRNCAASSPPCCARCPASARSARCWAWCSMPAVIATKLFGAAFPDWFGSISASTYSLFQIMTWKAGRWARPSGDGGLPPALLFFVSFIMLSTFTVQPYRDHHRQHAKPAKGRGDGGHFPTSSRRAMTRRRAGRDQGDDGARPPERGHKSTRRPARPTAFAVFKAMMVREFFPGRIGKNLPRAEHPFASIVWLFEELGLPYELVLFKLGAPEMRAPEYRKVHPMAGCRRWRMTAR